MQFTVGERLRYSLLALPAQCDTILGWRAEPLIQAALDNVHAPADAPARPWLAAGEIDDFVVRSRKTDVEVFENCVPEPLDVLGGALPELVKRRNALLLQECEEPAAFGLILRRPPDDLTAGLP